MSGEGEQPWRLRVAFDGRAFDAPAGGVRRYVSELVSAVHRVSPASELVAIGGDAVPTFMRHRRASLTAPTNLGWCATGLPLAAARTAFDVFHAPAYTAPLWGAHPLVVTIHDVSYARRPEWSPHPGGVGPMRQWFYRRCARRATRIITDSTFSAREIAAAYDVDPSGIDVVPLGVGSQFVVDDRVSREPLILHVGDLHPRRNLEMLLDVAMTLAREPGLSALRLVLIGRDLGSLEALRRRAVAAGRPDVLHHAGQPSDQELLRWYQRAAVFAYPSRYEGFGLPLLEAMACGTPVVASNAASIPEVVGDAGVLLDPDNAEAWRNALARVLDDTSHAATMSRAGLDRAGLFTWTHTARLTLESYSRARR